jgi:putative aminopeptidase FrvX
MAAVPKRKPAPSKKSSRPAKIAGRAQRRPPDGSIARIKRLSEALGVSGDESAVREIILESLQGAAAETRVDALGNLLVKCRARGKPALRVMLAAHMDEVGLMLMQAGTDGLWKFGIVGGVDETTLPGKSLVIGKDRIPGVIGMKPVHLVEKEEAKNPVKPDALAIDVGATDKDSASARLKPGDRAAFATPFRFERGVLSGKALDNRLGVAALIELALDPPRGVELWAAFTAQEEVGLRGARVAAYAIDPDLAIVLDATPALDLPMWDGSENVAFNTRLGAGPAIYIADRATVSDPRLVRILDKAGEARGIPRQFRQPGSGGTDAGAIHRTRKGIPSVSVSVPIRNPHAPVSTARAEDWRALVALVRAALDHLGKLGFREG